MRRHPNLLLSLVLLTVLSPLNSWAYKPESGHKVLNTVAIKYYNLCANELNGSFTPALVPIKGTKDDKDSDFGQVLQYNLDEDASIWGFPRRIFNWHFFRASIQDRNTFFLGAFDKSMGRMVEGIYEDIVPKDGESNEDYLLTQDDINRLTGRVMHFVEDTTVPAHVTPVWHGPFVSDEFDSIPVIESKLDMAIDQLFPKICHDIKAEILESNDFKPTEEITNELINILGVTSEETFNNLEKEACKTKGGESHDWTIFWTPPPKEDDGFNLIGKDYFGSYTNCKIAIYKDDENGKEQTVIKEVTSYFPQNTCNKPEEDNLTSECKITKSDIEDFVKIQHINAVKADIKALFWLSQNILREDRSNEEKN